MRTENNLIYALVFLLTLFPFIGNGAVVADFSVQSSSGCVPLVVNFTDNSSGNIIYWHWDFGNGNSASQGPNVGTTYLVSGVYTISLTVSDGVDTAMITKPQFITVFPRPTANFNPPGVTGCTPHSFNVNDASTSTGSPIVSWKWNFDDGTGNHLGQNLVHSYTQSGSYDITLVVENAAGCQSQKHIAQAITVSESPVASFSSTDTLNPCAFPVPISFINSSVFDSGMLHSSWLIDGNSISAYHTSYTFLNNGSYDIQLSVVDSNGCSDTAVISNMVNIGPLTSLLQAPATGCPNSGIMFTATCLGADLFEWDMGNGNPIQTGDTQYVNFSNGGVYQVQLVTSKNGTCKDTVTHNISIDTVEALFSSTPSFACESPLIVQFTDLSVGNIVDWDWHFGYANNNSCLGCLPITSAMQHPTNVYYSQGVYNDTLTITTANGCTDSYIAYANEEIHVIETDFQMDVSNGCGPLTVEFTNNSSPVDSIDYVLWDFDDGTALDTTFSPVHTFVSPGSYTVNLQVVSVSGCTTNVSQLVNVGSLQNAMFSFDTTMACANDTVRFTNLSTDSNIIDEYLWLFTDGQSQAVPNPEVLFIDTGHISVTLVVGHNQCYDTLTIDSAIYSSGPILELSSAFDCDSINVIEFNIAMKGGTQLWYDYGDSSGIDSSGLLNNIHAYPPVDSAYVFSSWAVDSNTGCTFSMDTTLSIDYYHAQIWVSDSTPCFGDTIQAGMHSMINVTNNVFWSINTLNSFNHKSLSLPVGVSVHGLNYIYASIEATNGCLDTITRVVQAFQPSADFSADTNWGCAPFTAQFTDLSISDTNITSWDWDYGDLATGNTQHPTHVYTGTGLNTYPVKLIVTDTFGCKSTLLKNNLITTQQPKSRFYISNPLACEGDTVTFYGMPSGNLSYWWIFSDGEVDSVKSPQKNFDTAGVYSVSLTVTDAQGCSHSLAANGQIKIQSYPLANFTGTPLFTECYPELITFRDSSISNFPLTWSWNFGDSPNYLNISQDSAKNLYNYPGLYDVTLIATTSNGCADTITKPNLVFIGGPTAQIFHNPKIACINDEVAFWVDSTNSEAEKFVWDFANGTIDSNFTEVDTLFSSFIDSGWMQITLTYSDSFEVCKQFDTAMIYVHEVIADFNTLISDLCTPVDLQLTNTSIENNKQYWYLDSAFVDSSINFSQVIANPGMHSASILAFNDSTNCSNSKEFLFEVYPLPDLNTSSDAVLCIGDSIGLFATGAEIYSWSPNTYLSSDSIPNVIATPDSSISYHITGTDTNGCINYDSIYIYVQPMPELTYMDTNTTIFLGEELGIEAIVNLPVRYSWSPSWYLDCSSCGYSWASPNQTITYTLTYSDSNNCFTSDTSLTITVLDEYAIHFPNAFTPNKDGLNDTFKPKVFGIKEIMHFQIYDRWGRLVFETTELNKGWDGMSGDQVYQNNAMFSYRYKAKRYNNKMLEQVGSFLLISE